MSHDFDIRAAIRDVLDDTDLTSPDEIAARIVLGVPPKDLRSVLMVVLREFVRTQFHHYDRRPPQERPHPTTSANVAAVRAWARILRRPVAIEDNVWKRFGECDRDDLVFLASERRQNASRSIAAAVRFEKYTAAMDEHGAATVSDLPDDVIASIEGGDL